MLDGVDGAPLDAARLIADLEEILTGAKADRTWAPALRAVELLGKHGGIWKSDAQPQTSLAELINQAANVGGDPEQSD